MGNKLFETAEHFRYLGTTLTHLLLLSSRKSGNVCYHSVKNLLSSSVLSKYIKNNPYTELTFFLFFCTGVKLGRSHGGRNTGWRCSRIGCWGRYLGIRGTR